MRATLGVGISVIVAAAGLFAFSPRVSPPMQPHQTPIQTMNVTDITRTSAGLIAAGELENILVSTDQGVTWQKANIAEKRHALITRLHFTNDSLGFALGHEGLILRTTDSGKNWTEVAFNSQRSEPFMSIQQLPDQRWMVIGAFGQLITSTDEGLTWQQADSFEGTDWHLNAIVSSKDQQTWLVIGEAGTVFRSTDAASTWEQIPEFYNGSFYGGLHLGGDSWLIYGMRGNIFRSDDNGQTWAPVDFNIPISLFAHDVLQDGRILLAGQGGIILSSNDQGNTFSIVYRGARASITSLYHDNDQLYIGSDKGLAMVDIEKIKHPDNK